MYIVGQWLARALQIMVVRGHGRAVCAVAFVACVTGDECCVLLLII